MATAEILKFPSASKGIIGWDYTGLIVSHNPDGSGTVQLRSPPELRGQTIAYWPETTIVDSVRERCHPGMAVEGRITLNFPAPGWNIRLLEPLGGVAEILAPQAPPPGFWKRLLKAIWA